MPLGGPWRCARDAQGAALAIKDVYREMVHDDPSLIEDAARVLASDGSGRSRKLSRC